MLKRLARFCYLRRRRVVLGWIALLFALFAFSGAIGSNFHTEFKLPGSDSQAALDLLEQRGFGVRTGVQGSVVFEAEDGVDDTAVRTAMEDLFAVIEEKVRGTEVVSPYEDGQEHQIASRGALADRVAYAEVNFTDRAQEQYLEDADTVKAAVARVDVPGLRIELGGEVFRDELQFSSEAVGLLGAIVILLIAFGSLLAMGLPILTSLFGIGSGIALVELGTHLMPMPDFTTQIAAMLGIGVGIDYALFILTRYRQGLHDGLDPEAAVVRSMDTAGRAVVFAGTTVIISVLGMFVIGLEFIRGLAVGTVLAVLMTMVASVTLLPAMLGFVGRNIDRFGLPALHHAEGKHRQSFWFRWSRVVQRRPWPALVVGLLVLVLLGAPVFGMRLGFGDTGNLPVADSARRGYDLLSRGFGPGFNGPLLLAAEVSRDADSGALDELADRLAATRGVATVTPAFENDAGTAAIMTVYPTTSPQSEATEGLLVRLRERVIPAATRGTGVSVKVGGLAAGAVDFAEYTSERLPYFIGAVLLFSFLLLLVVFRSLLVPIKAVVMNLLSIGASYGVVVMVFQWGWGADLIGVGKNGPIEAWAPMMLFAIVFGLSMDYEVFLLSRIREEYDRTGDNALAVADGLAATARVITAAAAIMVCVFGAFVLGSDRSLKLFGLGLAVAVFVDATVVRMVLVPAAMELMGDRNWWIPAWLDRRLPVVHVDAIDDVDAELAELVEPDPASR